MPQVCLGPSHSAATAGACAHAPSAPRKLGPWPHTAQLVGRQVQQPSVATWWGKIPFLLLLLFQPGPCCCIACVPKPPCLWIFPLKATDPGKVDSFPNLPLALRCIPKLIVGGSSSAGIIWDSPEALPLLRRKTPSPTPLPVIATWFEEHPHSHAAHCCNPTSVPERKRPLTPGSYKPPIFFGGGGASAAPVAGGSGPRRACTADSRVFGLRAD